MLLLTLLTSVQFVCSSVVVPQNLTNVSIPPFSEHQFSMVKRIIGGAPVDDAKYLWAVSLQVDENTGLLARFKINYLPLCGGSLISSRWIVTASHCFYYTQEPSRWRVRLGYGNIHAGYWETAKNWFYRHYGYQRQTLKPYYEVKEIFMHPEFHPQGLYKDIALVYLKESVPFKAVPGFAPLRLPKHTPTGVWPPPGSNCIAIGWGCGGSRGAVRDQQHAVELTTIPHSLCGEIYKNKELSPFKLCAGFVRQGKGLCHGDSGGPLVCPSVDGKEILAGVANSGNLNGPSIFTGASHFRTWIDSVLRYHHTLE